MLDNLNLHTPACSYGAWEEERNRQKVQIHWRFTTKEARKKLKRLYPS
ncbi:gsr3829 [Gloeobacter violaceus PCC 7421]|uniref:Gsr3829 protein n=1 Tax=Gloeobacter violaceus (strain ATCC 29082 / PCC 7421) TaxID=251221 RepID=Q7NEP9_GLOVI|nr:gsr3829 [Gloeobacter violaceus PCC 7421]